MTTLCQNETTLELLKTSENKVDCVRNASTTHTSKRNEYVNENLRLRKERFLIRAKDLHRGKYDYSLVDYTNAHVKINILCPLHGVFSQLPLNHLKGNGCPICKRKRLAGKFSGNDKDFINKANGIHNNLYDYSEVKYKNARVKVTIICRKHGKFDQTPDKHLYGQGCPLCCASKGEIKIGTFLHKNKIDYIKEKRFSNCINPLTAYQLPFDFYIPSHNLLIEFDGIQHYKVNMRVGGYITTQSDLDYITVVFLAKDN